MAAKCIGDYGVFAKFKKRIFIFRVYGDIVRHSVIGSAIELNHLVRETRNGYWRPWQRCEVGFCIPLYVHGKFEKEAVC